MAIPGLGVEYQKAKEELRSIDEKGHDLINSTREKIDKVYHKEKEKIEDIAAKNKKKQEEEWADFALKKASYDQYLRNQHQNFNYQVITVIIMFGINDFDIIQSECQKLSMY